MCVRQRERGREKKSPLEWTCIGLLYGPFVWNGENFSFFFYCCCFTFCLLLFLLLGSTRCLFWVFDFTLVRFIFILLLHTHFWLETKMQWGQLHGNSNIFIKSIRIFFSFEYVILCLFLNYFILICDQWLCIREILPFTIISHRKEFLILLMIKTEGWFCKFCAARFWRLYLFQKFLTLWQLVLF